MFAACYVALDWASYIYPLGPFNITPWNPPPALSIVWMMLGGIAYAPLVFGTIFMADVIIRDAPGGLLFSAMSSLVLAGGYTAIAATLRQLLKPAYRLNDTRDVWIFASVMAIGSAIIAAVYVGVLWGYHFVVGELFSALVFSFWLGDTVGVLVTAPLLLIAVDAAGRARLRTLWRRPDPVLRFALMAATVFFVFKGIGSEPEKYFYFLFLPLILIALRDGFAGTAVASAIVQIGVVLGAQGAPLNSLALVELQALVAALSLTGLFLGVLADERARAIDALKATLRLAAAGEMAGAIAHEINQPLGALSNYGRVCQFYLGRGEGKVPYGELNETIEKMLVEVKRAADVVGRLRDFFRTGTTRLEHVTVASLLEIARGIGARLDASGEVDFRVEADASEAVVMVDRLQIELVLRNLIANAFEAIANLPAGRKRITVAAQPEKGGRILIRISDSGPGLTPAARKSLFEPLSTTKSQGMGLGLAISRAIAEAHGGTLRATLGEQSEFQLRLPGLTEDE